MNAQRLTFLCALVFGLLAGCQSVPYQATNQNDIDSLSRDVSQNQGGAIHDPSSLSAPPVHRNYVDER